MAAATEGSTKPKFYEELKPSTDDGDWVSYEDLLVSLSQSAERAERYDDMCEFLTEVANSKFARKAALKENERNLLSVAFKNVVGGLRSSWRTFKNSELAEDDQFDPELLSRYSKIVESELEQQCLDVLALLEHKLLPVCEDGDESRVFFLKMSGDYYRYLAEFAEKPEYKDNARTNYENALTAAEKHLPETHPTRLGLALNFSVCYYEILKEQRKACELAKKAFDQAIQKLDTLNDSNYKDSTLIMQLLRDNLTLWTSEAPAENED